MTHSAIRLGGVQASAKWLLEIAEINYELIAYYVSAETDSQSILDLSLPATTIVI